jgi:hypothetical protein
MESPVKPLSKATTDAKPAMALNSDMERDRERKAVRQKRKPNTATQAGPEKTG